MPNGRRRYDLAVLVATQVVGVVVLVFVGMIWNRIQQFNERVDAGWLELEAVSQSLEPPSGYREIPAGSPRHGQVDCVGLFMTCWPGSATVGRAFELQSGQEPMSCTDLAAHATREWDATVTDEWRDRTGYCSVRFSIAGHTGKIRTFEDELTVRVSTNEAGPDL